MMTFQSVLAGRPRVEITKAKIQTPNNIQTGRAAGKRNRRVHLAFGHLELWNFHHHGGLNRKGQNPNAKKYPNAGQADGAWTGHSFGL
jgi:hypothetical protein